MYEISPDSILSQTLSNLEWHLTGTINYATKATELAYKTRLTLRLKLFKFHEKFIGNGNIIIKYYTISCWKKMQFRLEDNGLAILKPTSLDSFLLELKFDGNFV